MSKDNGDGTPELEWTFRVWLLSGLDTDRINIHYLMIVNFDSQSTFSIVNPPGFVKPNSVGFGPLVFFEMHFQNIPRL